MEKKTILIADASAAQLRDFGTLAFGMELGGRETVNQMITKLSGVGFTGEEFAVIDDTAPSDQSERIANAMGISEVNGRRYIRINVNVSEKPGGDQPVPVSVNGVAMLIERGKDCDVLEEYVEALQNAKQDIPIVTKEGHITGYRTKHAYPFSRVAA